MDGRASVHVWFSTVSHYDKLVDQNKLFDQNKLVDQNASLAGHACVWLHK